MSFLDRFIHFWTGIDMPKFRAYSESYTGGSQTIRSMRNWLPPIGSANTDFDTVTQQTLVARCRDAYRNQALPRAAIDRLKHNVIGPGLRLQARLDYEYLNLSEEEAGRLERVIEREFDIWANTPNCDIERSLNFYAIQTLLLVSMLISGDVFVNTPFLERKDDLFGFKIQIIEGDRVSNPSFSPDSTRLIRGIELDSVGSPVIYHILSAHPGDILSANSWVWEKVPVFSKTGRRRVFHLFEKERPGQIRGIPYLSPILEYLRQLACYTEAELTAAVVSGLFAVFVKTEGGLGFPSNTSSTTPPEKKDQLALKSGMVVNLAPGESIEPANPQRPNTSYDPFVQAILRQIGAALGLPIEFLQLYFASSYSAARASLLQAWKLITYYRSLFIYQFCQPIYELWFDELVARGRIEVKNYTDPRIRAAYTRATWIGPSRGAIDENKEVDAARSRIELGISTLQIEAEELQGQDWLDIHKQRLVEKKKRVEAGLEPKFKQDSEKI